jgi:hypothetical protein
MNLNGLKQQATSNFDKTNFMKFCTNNTSTDFNKGNGNKITEEVGTTTCLGLNIN